MASYTQTVKVSLYVGREIDEYLAGFDVSKFDDGTFDDDNLVTTVEIEGNHLLVNKLIDDDLALTGSLSREVGKLLTNTATLTGASKKNVGKNLSESLALSDANYKSVKKGISNSLAATSTLQRVISVLRRNSLGMSTDQTAKVMRGGWYQVFANHTIDGTDRLTPAYTAVAPAATIWTEKTATTTTWGEL